MTDPVESARAVGLRYVSDTDPGIRRAKAGKGFYYVDPEGRRVTDKETIKRIRSLVIPPAWKGVWICPDPTGHLQATGFDDRHRKQYRYHTRWREIRDAVKYDRMVAFGKTLPTIRERIEHNLDLPGMPRGKVLAAIVHLLDTTYIRVGNDEYRRENRSYGLTTLRNRHAEVIGSRVRFSFRGKSGRKHSVEVTNRRIARVVSRCQELPGQELFRYLDDNGVSTPVGSGDVNEYIKEISGGDFTAKDFRTWAGSVIATDLLSEVEPAGSERERKKQLSAAVEEVASQLGNTPTVCRKCYVHPAVVDSFTAGTLRQTLGGSDRAADQQPMGGLSPEEQIFMALLEAQPAPSAKAA